MENMMGQRAKLLPGIIMSAFSLAAVAGAYDVAEAAGADNDTDNSKSLSSGPVEKSLLQDITDQDFTDEVENSKGLVLVEFWAPWCPSCKKIAPILEELAEQRAEDLRVVKINIDDNPIMKKKYNIPYIPMMILFKDGEEVSRDAGVIPLSELTSWIDSVDNATDKKPSPSSAPAP
jgi:thioredoxin 1